MTTVSVTVTVTVMIREAHVASGMTSLTVTVNLAGRVPGVAWTSVLTTAKMEVGPGPFG